MGTPDFAVPTLDALVAGGHDIACVYTQPPRPANRGKRDTLSPVHAHATALGLAVRTPSSLKNESAQAEFAALAADVAVVAAYGLLLPPAILQLPRHGCLNVHGSLLPRWRGAAPVQRAILAGDAQTGVAIMQMEAGLDTGPVRLEGRTSATGKTAGDLTIELAQIGAALMGTVLAELDRHPPVLQNAEGVTYAAKITKDEARIDWNLSAVQVERMVRAFNPAPGAWCMMGEQRVKILAAELLSPVRGPIPVAPGTVTDDTLTIACNPGAIRPLLLQRSGRAPMAVGDFLHGFAVPAGTRLA